MTETEPNQIQTDPWRALGLERTYDVDPDDVRRAHRKKSALLHPDRAPGLDDSEIARASAEINDAKRVLLDPEDRAAALLALLGGASASEDRSLPDGFLEETMMLRMEIESELAEGGDEARAKWRGWAQDKRRGYEAEVAELFGRATGDGVLAEIRLVLNAWRYTERLIEQLDPAYSGLDDAADTQA
ncbi:MAG: DnaJ domain-containing protein [Planctomycetota bacterium]